MRRLILLPAALVTVLLAGCRGPETVERLPLLPSVPPAQLVESQGQRDMMEFVDRQMRLDPEPGTKFFTQADAKPCPKVKVTTAQDQRTELQPGREGYVTLVLVWSLDLAPGRAALTHVNDLERRYHELRVRAVGVVQRTPSADTAGDAAAWLGARFPLYYDDLSQSALKRLAKAAGAKQPKAVPAFFIIDRRLRLRLYRPYFPFTVLAADPLGAQRPGGSEVRENAPPGKSIEDYLKKVLKEG